MFITNDLVNEVNSEVKGFGFEVSVNQCHKNNVVRDGLVIRNVGADNSVCPTVYIDDLEDMDEVIDRIINVGRREVPSYDIAEMVSRDYILSHVSAEVVSKDNVALVGVVHRDFLDLSILYRVMVDDFCDGVASFAIHTDVLDRAGLDEADLFEVVSHNEDYSMKNIAEVLAESMGIDAEYIADMMQGPQIYVVSNKSKIHGASVLCTSYLERIWEELCGQDYYIIPSSIHEILVIPSSDEIEPLSLFEMVQMVNSTEVREEDRLTDAVYFYGNSGLTKVA